MAIDISMSVGDLARMLTDHLLRLSISGNRLDIDASDIVFTDVNGETVSVDRIYIGIDKTEVADKPND